MSVIKRLNPREAWAMLQADSTAILLDVRDRVEFTLVGHPVGALNIPWKDAPEWKANPHFPDEVKRLIPDHDAAIYVLCRSGQRSLDAAKALEALGYGDLTNIEEGFEGPLDELKHRGTRAGWRFNGLPWEQN